MSTETSSNNKRIAKNTLYLYIRMVLIMLVSLYTVRVVLSALGVVDYGIYNVVGGIVSMFSFLSGTMASASQRFFSYELGRDNLIQLKRTFSLTVTIYVVISILIFVFAETIGLWFLNTQMTIPYTRLNAANWVYQFSILSFILTILTIPYDASIIAHEKMNIYAWVSILQVCLKLFIVYLLAIANFDRLKFYAVLMFIVIFITCGVYFLYCKRKFTECRRYYFYWESTLFRQMLGYSGWNMIGSLASIGKNQGLNILLNIFFNPVVNAAMSLAAQINATISQFISNLYISTRPQIIKYYSAKNYSEMWKITYFSSKITFYMYMLIAIPLFFEIDFILKIWLKKVPSQTNIFVRFLLINFLIECVYNQLSVVFQAANKLKKIQLLDSTLVLMLIPISYVIFLFHRNYIIPFIIMLCISIIRIFTYSYIAKGEIELSVDTFYKKIVFREILVLFLSLILPGLIFYYCKNQLLQFTTVCLFSCISSILIIWYVGLNRGEQVSIINIIRKHV